MANVRGIGAAFPMFLKLNSFKVFSPQSLSAIPLQLILQNVMYFNVIYYKHPSLKC